MTVCLALLGFALLSPPASAADNCQAPPGTSGIDQYCEVLPSAGGTGKSHHGGGKGGGADSSLPKQTARVLRSQGAAGASVLALTRSGSAPAAPTPDAKRSGGSHEHHGSGGAQQQHSAGSATPAADRTVRAAPASNPVSAVGKSLSGSGLGAGFIAVLAAIGALLAALAWFGRRRGEQAA
jgi:hypothetical protein